MSSPPKAVPVVPAAIGVLSALTSGAAAALRRLVDALSPMAGAGLGILVLLLAHWWFAVVLDVAGEGYEWGLYLALGTVFPAMILAAGLARRVSALVDVDEAWGPTARAGVAVVGLSVPFLALVRRQEWPVAVMALAQLLIVVACDRAAGRRVDPTRLAVAAVVLPIAWAAAVRLVYWTPLERLVFLSGATSPDVLTLSISAPFVVFGLSLALVTVALYGWPRARVDVPRGIVWAADAAAVLGLAILAFRTDELFAPGHQVHFIHWGVVIGPAELVRQGGWLLWDVPGQYGFLNALLAAALPVGSVWQATYVVISSAVLVAALCNYALSRAALRGPAGFALPFLLTWAAMFVMAGLPAVMVGVGPKSYPGNSPYRYVWVYVLLVLLALDYTTAGRRRRLIGILGSMAWVAGTLWSAESAVYCGSIWLPGYTLTALHDVAATGGASRSRLRDAGALAGWLLLPLGLLGASVGGIAGVYLIGLGHLPDGRAYFDHALAYSRGAWGVALDANGAVSAPLLGLLLITTAVACALRRGVTDPALAPLVGAWGAVWSTASYFVWNSHPNNAAAQSPILVTALAVVLLVERRSPSTGWTGAMVRLCMVPLFVVMLTVACGRWSLLARNLASLEQSPPPTVDRMLPPISPDLVDLLRSAGVTRTDRVVFVHETLGVGAWPDDSPDGPTLSTWSQPTWLPTFPLFLFDSLGDERSGLYISRFVSRTRSGGWLIQPRDAPYTDFPWLARALDDHFIRTASFEDATWQVIRFEYVGSP